MTFRSPGFFTLRKSSLRASEAGWTLCRVTISHPTIFASIPHDLRRDEGQAITTMSFSFLKSPQQPHQESQAPARPQNAPRRGAQWRLCADLCSHVVLTRSWVILLACVPTVLSLKGVRSWVPSSVPLWAFAETWKTRRWVNEACLQGTLPARQPVWETWNSFRVFHKYHADVKGLVGLFLCWTSQDGTPGQVSQTAETRSQQAWPWAQWKFSDAPSTKHTGTLGFKKVPLIPEMVI